MHDVENVIFQAIDNAVSELFPGISISNEFVRKPSSFPAVTVEETDNYPTKRNLDTADHIRFSTVIFDINVFSNKVVGRKNEVKQIMSVIDDVMYLNNFICDGRDPRPNEDETIYRYGAIYRAETDGENFYRP